MKIKVVTPLGNIIPRHFRHAEVQLSGGTNLFLEVFARTTKVLTALAPSPMKIKMVAQNTFTVGAKRITDFLWA